MNTPAHLLIGAAVFAKPSQKGTTKAAFLGAIAPDLSLYIMVAVSIWVLDVPAQTVFRTYYYSDAWQSVFAIDNSFILWGAAFTIALWRRHAVAIAFSGAGMLHLVFDFPFHTHDARQHFWPITDWVFHSPVSYWDSQAYAGVVGPIELALSLACAVILWRRIPAWPVRGLVGILALAETSSSGIWRFIF